MRTKNQKTFNAQVYEKTYQRLNISPTQRIIFQRLLGFLIRNNKPFPYSAVKMADITGFSLRTVFTTLNDLENYRLILRQGLGNNRKFIRGSILNKILTTVQNRSKVTLNKSSTTVQLSHQNLINRAAAAYSKTSLSLKPKDKELISLLNAYQEYVGKIKSGIIIKILSEDAYIMSLEEFKKIYE